jgi:hypothetical protein
MGVLQGEHGPRDELAQAVQDRLQVRIPLTHLSHRDITATACSLAPSMASLRRAPCLRWAPGLPPGKRGDRAPGLRRRS